MSTQHSVLSTQYSNRAYIVVDRLSAGNATEKRIRDTLETAFAKETWDVLRLWRGDGDADSFQNHAADFSPSTADLGGGWCYDWLDGKPTAHRIPLDRAAIVQL